MLSSLKKSLKFEPVNRFFKFGNEIQICKTTINGISVFWTTYFPFNIFQEPTDTFTVDLCLPMNTKIPNGQMTDAGYFEKGYGCPAFKKLDYAIEYAENFSNNEK